MDGIVIVDKPRGCTSHYVVKKIKKFVGAKKVGHGGTLDPLATGVLPVFINKATKLVPFVMGGHKRYLATLMLGVATDTQDCEGTITAKCDNLPRNPHLIIQTFNSFKGTIEQVPPMFSALKSHGLPLYKLARKGVQIDRTPRKIQIYEITIVGIHLPYVTFETICSPGTYIRTLCADVGRKLSCGAHLVSLKRLQSGMFPLSKSLSLERVEFLSEHNLLKENLFSLAESFSHLPLTLVQPQVINVLKKSGTLFTSHLNLNHFPSIVQGELIKVACREETLIALVQSTTTLNSTEVSSANTRLGKLICFFNPHENTIH